VGKLTARTLVLPRRAVELPDTDNDAESCPVFAAPKGGLRDPSNTQAVLRAAFKTTAAMRWVMRNFYRRTVASLMDDAGKTARAVDDQRDHNQPSMS